MRIDPQLLALRGNASPQREAQGVVFAAREAWRADPRAAGVLGELAEHGNGEALPRCPLLHAAITRRAAGDDLVTALLDHLLPALRAEPLGQVPLRQSSGNGVSTLLLAKEGRAMLLLSAREAGSAASDAVSFSDGERHELVLAGEADARLVRIAGNGPDGARLAIADVPLQPRVALSLDLACEALKIDSVKQRLVCLRLVRAAEAPRPTRGYRMADGKFLHQAAGDVRESRYELMLALLGRMGRAGAAPVIAEMSREGSEHIRWQALRECIALDTATGFGALSSIARDAADPLAGMAGALRAQLLEAHPVLSQLEEA